MGETVVTTIGKSALGTRLSIGAGEYDRVEAPRVWSFLFARCCEEIVGNNNNTVVIA